MGVVRPSFRMKFESSARRSGCALRRLRAITLVDEDQWCHQWGRTVRARSRPAATLTRSCPGATARALRLAGLHSSADVRG
jgi:hypothetical protein